MNEETNTTPETTETVAAPVTFADSLPEDLRSHASLSGFKDLAGLAKSYVDTKAMVGNSIRIPTDEAGDEQLGEFYGKLADVKGVMRKPDESNTEAMSSYYNSMGRPEEAANYDFQIPEGTQYDEGGMSEFKDLAHEMGLTNAQASKLIQYEMKRSESLSENYNTSKVDHEATLRKTWGNEYDNKLATAKRAAEVYGEKYPDAISELVNGPSGNNPALLIMLSEIGKQFKETGAVGNIESRHFGVSAEEAVQKISDIKMNASHAYNDINHPEHDAASEAMSRLYRAAYPD